ncbi:MAG: metallophosphoesterase [Reyranella sp.]|nr:metallophosphoesterase [Reyranella sp.]
MTRAPFIVRLTLALLAMTALCPIARAQEDSGAFAVISDIHFNPFDPPALAATLARSAPADWPATLADIKDRAMAGIGHDTNHALLASALAAFARATAGVDFAIVPGDFLTHHFSRKTAAALGVDERSPAVLEMTTKTTLFVTDALAKALGGKPAVIAFGNEDSSCGDYRIEPGGAYLAATREAVRRLAGADRLEPDFAETWDAAGYYAVRHPTVANGLIIVLNDVLWSPKYQDACGAHGLAAADAMMRWLRDRLVRQRAAGGKVWMVHHIPWGIDAYSTINPKAQSCPAKVAPFLKEPFASELQTLLAEYSDVVQASFSGHTHHDDYRLLIDRRGAVIGLDKLSPAVSPVFGQNPGFQIFTYDKRTGAPTDFSTWYLSNPGEAAAAADWRREYTFTEAYRQPRYGPDVVGTLWQAMAKDGAVRDTYRRLYMVGRGEIAADGLSAYLCAIGHLDVTSFTKCYCGDRR